MDSRWDRRSAAPATVWRLAYRSHSPRKDRVPEPTCLLPLMTAPSIPSSESSYRTRESAMPQTSLARAPTTRPWTSDTTAPRSRWEHDYRQCVRILRICPVLQSIWLLCMRRARSTLLAIKCQNRRRHTRYARQQTCRPQETIMDSTVGSPRLGERSPSANALRSRARRTFRRLATITTCMARPINPMAHDSRWGRGRCRAEKKDGWRKGKESKQWGMYRFWTKGPGRKITPRSCLHRDRTSPSSQKSFRSPKPARFRPRGTMLRNLQTRGQSSAWVPSSFTAARGQRPYAVQGKVHPARERRTTCVTTLDLWVDW
mmetsp:Transcript_39272/g.70330  ORF Transcript_39272/g.70330 Transcript_39272/m.70330 type:complete len:316 (+) Transcript_39272:433-1380(+)